MTSPIKRVTFKSPSVNSNLLKCDADARNSTHFGEGSEASKIAFSSFRRSSDIIKSFAIGTNKKPPKNCFRAPGGGNGVTPVLESDP